MGVPSRGQEASGHVKGSALREVLRWMRRHLGDDHAEALLARIPAPHRDCFDSSHEAFGILASTWYPAPVVHALCDAMTYGLSLAEQNALARDSSRALMEATLKGLYRFLFEQLVSPERFAALAPRVWRTYFDSGERRTVVVSPARHDCNVRDWHGHHRFLCLVQMHATTYEWEARECHESSCEDRQAPEELQKHDQPRRDLRKRDMDVSKQPRELRRSAAPLGPTVCHEAVSDDQPKR